MKSKILPTVLCALAAIACSEGGAPDTGIELVSGNKSDLAGAHVALVSPRFETERDPFLYCSGPSCRLTVWFEVLTPASGFEEVFVEVTGEDGYTSSQRTPLVMGYASFRVSSGKNTIHLRAVDPRALLASGTGDIELEIWTEWHADTSFGDAGAEDGGGCGDGWCGDGICCQDYMEDAWSCPSDCGWTLDAGTTDGGCGWSCGDGVCCPSAGEDPFMCSSDCAPADSGVGDAGGECVPMCGDLVCCASAGENGVNCTIDCAM